MECMTVSWFSAGVSSAVATKLAIADIDKILYTHIEDQHPDTLRFVKDCEEWFDAPIEILQSPFKSVSGACTRYGKGYINGPRGAECTRTLKRQVRAEWEYKLPLDTKLTYIWGMDINETNRLERLKTSMPDQKHRCPLIEQHITKEEAHQILKASGIKRPALYDRGYQNNNCIGCVKGGMGYWNKIRRDFPAVFKQRASMERQVGHSCINGVYLDELDPLAGRHAAPIVEECGIMCELMAVR